jgi:hypothetical protein
METTTIPITMVRVYITDMSGKILQWFKGWFTYAEWILLQLTWRPARHDAGLFLGYTIV